MGGIFFMFYEGSAPPVNIEFTKSFMNMKNRGPDDTHYSIQSTPLISRMNEDQIKLHMSKREMMEYKPFTFVTGYHRLSINDNSLDASQPFEDPLMHQILRYPELKSRPKRALVCNGEIYNYPELKDEFCGRDLQSSCDVEVIMPLYIKYGLEETLSKMNGDFAFILTENLNTFKLNEINIFAARDPLGVKPLYLVKSKRSVFYIFTSELKAIPFHILNSQDYTIQEVPPGTYWSFNKFWQRKGLTDDTEFTRYSDWDFYKQIDNCTYKTADPTTLEVLYKEIYERASLAVTQRLTSLDKNTKRQIGVLLSGGFDSSLVLSLIVEISVSQGLSLDIVAFTFGDTDSPEHDLANTCIEHLENKYGIDIQHHMISNSSMSSLTNILDEVIYSLETFDTKTIRDSIPLFFLFKYISLKTNVRVLFTGDGLNEMCGYKQLINLDDIQFQQKSVKLIKNMSKYKLLRCDKLSGKFGLELRHPFLDTSFIELMLSIHPKLKKPQVFKGKTKIEKYIVRKTFESILDERLVWNKGEDVYQSIRTFHNDLNDLYDNTIDKHFFLDCVQKWRSKQMTCIPKTKEDLYLKLRFDKLFPHLSTVGGRYFTDLFE